MSADGLKQRIGRILKDALRPTERYDYDDGFVRWGLVEKDIHAAVEVEFAAPSPAVERVLRAAERMVDEPLGTPGALGGLHTAVAALRASRKEEQGG